MILSVLLWLLPQAQSSDMATACSSDLPSCGGRAHPLLCLNDLDTLSPTCLEFLRTSAPCAAEAKQYCTPWRAWSFHCSKRLKASVKHLSRDCLEALAGHMDIGDHAAGGSSLINGRLMRTDWNLQPSSATKITIQPTGTCREQQRLGNAGDGG